MENVAAAEASPEEENVITPAKMAHIKNKNARQKMLDRKKRREEEKANKPRARRENELDARITALEKDVKKLQEIYPRLKDTYVLWSLEEFPFPAEYKFSLSKILWRLRDFFSDCSSETAVMAMVAVKDPTKEEFYSEMRVFGTCETYDTKKEASSRLDSILQQIIERNYDRSNLHIAVVTDDALRWRSLSDFAEKNDVDISLVCTEDNLVPSKNYMGIYKMEELLGCLYRPT